jgi:hypothetical protein
MLVARSAQLGAFLLERGGERLQPERQHQVAHIASAQVRQRQQRLRRNARESLSVSVLGFDSLRCRWFLVSAPPTLRSGRREPPLQFQ